MIFFFVLRIFFFFVNSKESVYNIYKRNRDRKFNDIIVCGKCNNNGVKDERATEDTIRQLGGGWYIIMVAVAMTDDVDNDMVVVVTVAPTLDGRRLHHPTSLFLYHTHIYTYKKHCRCVVV